MHVVAVRIVHFPDVSRNVPSHCSPSLSCVCPVCLSHIASSASSHVLSSTGPSVQADVCVIKSSSYVMYASICASSNQGACAQWHGSGPQLGPASWRCTSRRWCQTKAAGTSGRSRKRGQRWWCGWQQHKQREPQSQGWWQRQQCMLRQLPFRPQSQPPRRPWHPRLSLETAAALLQRSWFTSLNLLHPHLGMSTSTGGAGSRA